MSFENQVRDMMERFIDEIIDVEDMEDYDGDINGLIWSEIEAFGKVAIEVIWEYLGDDFVQEVADEIIEEKREEID